MLDHAMGDRDVGMDVMERVGLRGEVHLTVLRGDPTPNEVSDVLAGRIAPERVITYQYIPNLVTNTGRAGTATIMATGTTRPTYIGVGNSAITPAVTDTSLSGEIDRNSITTSVQFQTYYARFATTFGAAEFNDTVRGIGLFTSSSGGDMWALVSANTLKDASSALVVDWRIQVTTV